MVLSILIALIGLAGCSAPPTATLPPSPQTISVSVPLALTPMQAALAACAGAHPDLLINLLESPNRPPEPTDADLSLWLGDPPEDFESALLLAEESLGVIVHPASQLAELSAAQLRAIFSGQTRDWSDLDLEPGEIQVWVYPDGDQVREIFDRALLEGETVTALANLAPTPEAMIAAVAGDPGGIGYAPLAFLSSAVKQVDMDPELKEALTQPILGLSQKEPGGARRDLLRCLQSGEGQASIAENYALWDRE